MMHYDHNHQFVALRQRAMMQRAAQERLANTARSSRRVMRLRFYDPVMAQFGRWLVASGYRLQKRYGDWAEFAPQPKPVPCEQIGVARR